MAKKGGSHDELVSDRQGKQVAWVNVWWVFLHILYWPLCIFLSRILQRWCTLPLDQRPWSQHRFRYETVPIWPDSNADWQCKHYCKQRSDFIISNLCSYSFHFDNFLAFFVVACPSFDFVLLKFKFNSNSICRILLYSSSAAWVALLNSTLSLHYPSLDIYKGFLLIVWQFFCPF